MQTPVSWKTPIQSSKLNAYYQQGTQSSASDTTGKRALREPDELVISSSEEAEDNCAQPPGTSSSYQRDDRLAIDNLIIAKDHFLSLIQNVRGQMSVGEKQDFMQELIVNIGGKCDIVGDARTES